jgi:hemerythrin
MSVGNAELDSQHKMLIQNINELHDASVQGKGKEKAE